jgi:protocatechuate 4,5-dioxygenase alpha chain
MCFSFNRAENRAAFKADEEAYMRSFGLNPRQAHAIRERDVLGLIAAGGNVYYLAKFAGILGLDVQDLGAAQTGMTKAEFKARLVEQNLQPETL